MDALNHVIQVVVYVAAMLCLGLAAWPGDEKRIGKMLTRDVELIALALFLLANLHIGPEVFEFLFNNGSPGDPVPVAPEVVPTG